jgi:hypothetical protein
MSGIRIILNPYGSFDEKQLQFNDYGNEIRMHVNVMSKSLKSNHPVKLNT